MAQAATATKPGKVRNPITRETAPTAPVPIKPPKMDLNRKVDPKARESEITMQVDGHKCARVEFWLRPEHTLEDALRPEFWSQVAYKFQRPIAAEGNYAGSIIEVRYPDLTLYAELFVRAVQARGLLVDLLFKKEIGLQEIASDKFESRWDETKRGYDIIRMSDREIVGDAKDFPTKDAVQNWLDKTVGA